jgi:hypothetical protein
MPGDTAIDFARSGITWLLPEQPSYGRFAIDASLSLPDGETFYLCAQVFAGNVYGDGPLFKDPPYEFSAAFSASRYRIFRDAVRGPALEDSYGNVADRFRDLRIEVERARCDLWRPAKTDKAFGPVSARVQMKGAVLEFPVRHINTNAEAGRFQIETGPVLIAEDGSGDIVTRLRRAYVIIGRVDGAEFLIDGERAGPPSGRWAQRISLRCETQIFQAVTGSTPSS